MEITAVIAAGGKGMRMGAQMNKIFLELMGKTVIEHTVSVFDRHPLITEIIVVTAKDDIEKCKSLIGHFGKVAEITEGGASRRDSVYRGLKKAGGDFIAIHDAARALITENIISEAIIAAQKYGAAAPGVICKDTLKKADKQGYIEKTIKRDSTYIIQTPQVFRRDIIINVHENIKDIEVTDDCVLAEKSGVKIKITDGSYENIKLTTPEDIIIGEEILKKRMI